MFISVCNQKAVSSRHNFSHPTTMFLDKLSAIASCMGLGKSHSNLNHFENSTSLTWIGLFYLSLTNLFILFTCPLYSEET